MPKLCENAETLSGSNVSGLEKAHAGSSGINISRNEPKNNQEAPREADTKILESLISTSLSCSLLEKLALSEGLQGYTENNSFSDLLKGVEKGNEQNLVQNFLFKHQQDLPSSRLSAASHYNQHVTSQPAYSFQEQMLQSRNQPFANTMGQFGDLSYSHTTTGSQQLLLEQQQKILQLLQQLLLQQQVLRLHEQNKYSQVVQSTIPIDKSSSGHLHAVEIPPSSVFTDYVGIRVSQEMMQTDSHVPAFTLQDVSTVSFTSLPSQVPKDVVVPSHLIGNLDQAPHEMLQNNSGVPVCTMENVGPTGFASLPPQVPEDVNYGVVSETIVPLLPHQFFENTTNREGWDATLSKQPRDTQNKGFMASSTDILEEPLHLKEQFNGDTLVEDPNGASSLPLQPLIMYTDTSVDVVNYTEVKDTKRIRKKSERGKAAGMNAIKVATSTNESVSCSILKDAELHQKKEAVLTFPSDPDFGDFARWKGKPALQEGSAQSKFPVEDDMFWGLLDQSNHEDMRTGIQSLGSFDSWVSNPLPVKGSLAGITNSKKSSNSVPFVNSHSSAKAASQSSHKGKKGNIDKHSEAMEFRAWCESEIMRLTGSKDTTFLEFCLNQPSSEAEMLLKDNLASYDPNHVFIDTFLNHKELLSAEVVEIAFQPHIDQWASGPSTVMGSKDADPCVAGGHHGSKGRRNKNVRKGRR